MNYAGKGIWIIDGVEIISDHPLSDEDAADRRQGRRPEADLEWVPL